MDRAISSDPIVKVEMIDGTVIEFVEDGEDEPFEGVNFDIWGNA
jgi:hypothetical protein